MTFQEAKTALAALAGKESYALSYELFTTKIYGDDRDIFPTCGVYIAGKKWHNAKTWTEALKELSDSMGITEAEASEAPAGEDAIAEEVAVCQ